MTASLRARIAAGEVVIGTFIKTPAVQGVEILGRAGLDFAVVDQEHAPIGIEAMDLLSLAARAAGLPLLSRRWGAGEDWISPLLDLGLTGVMVPHVADATRAEAVMRAMKFGRGQRGLSNSPRAGDYGGLTLEGFRSASDETTVAMLQIEDASALPLLDQIAAVPQVDVLFVGPADLSFSMQVPMGSDALGAAIDQVVAAARRAGVAAGLFVADESQIAPWVARGVTVFVVGSDQGLLKKAAQRVMTAARG